MINEAKYSPLIQKTAPEMPQAPEADIYERRYQTLPTHLTGMVHDEWALWRNVVVRGAGFPIAWILELAASSCAELADRLRYLEVEVMQASEMASYHIRARQIATNDEQEQRMLSQVLKALKKGRLETIPKLVELEHVRTLRKKLQVCQQEFAQAYELATQQNSHALRQIAEDKQFREAIIWQNRIALHASIAALLRHDPAQRGAEQRRREALVANYIQRYCTKNESIGFFGPLGWASFSSDVDTIAFQPGKALLASRDVYFEGWAIDSLAEVIATDTSVLPYCKPRLLPHVLLEGALLIVPFARPVKLTSRQALILQYCNGKRAAKDIARRVLEESDGQITNEADVYTVLTHLRSMKRITWTLEVPTEGTPRSHPEQRLRAVLAGIEDQQLRQEKLVLLDTLVQARDVVRQAAGDADTLDTAFGHLEETFTALTHKESHRASGRIYAGRTLVYEDCRRDIEMKLGPQFVQALEQPLALLLQSARWFTYETATRYRKAFCQAFADLKAETGKDRINFANFWLWAQPLLFDESAERPIDGVIKDFQERWLYILATLPYERRASYTSKELRPFVQEVFTAPGPGWKDACYHSPDILVRATSTDAISQDDYELILGELHIATNTQQHQAFIEQYPDPDRLISFVVSDIPEPRIVPILSQQRFPATRMRPAFNAAKDIRLVYSADVVPDQSAQVLAISELEITQQGETLVAETKDGQCFDIIEVFAEFLSRIVYKEFNLLPTGRYMPRMTVDRMVIMRETWSFHPTELSFTHEKDAGKRFMLVNSWAQAHHIPRFVFLKVASEFKPTFIDMTSPVYVEAFVKLVRYNQENGQENDLLHLSEMLPEPDQTWLTDNKDHHYSCELRMVAVDMIKNVVIR
ncbi:lantibiotic dehydratase [Dictyobacter alpinus]|uniref:Lantibiotic dehydratase n=1 Tax=Dictyobacter alpinus TaxID=2014873 RepID=A0A402BIW3_9CHLR|nr:lantibiotic dehydratase [Dictyobacter alpinus]GCE31305.1 lantibiotic dehydratase [Dictyobacter alpinus]